MKGILSLVKFFRLLVIIGTFMKNALLIILVLQRSVVELLVDILIRLMLTLAVMLRCKSVTNLWAHVIS